MELPVLARVDRLFRHLNLGSILRLRPTRAGDAGPLTPMGFHRMRFCGRDGEGKPTRRAFEVDGSEDLDHGPEYSVALWMWNRRKRVSLLTSNNTPSTNNKADHVLGDRRERPSC